MKLKEETLEFDFGEEWKIIKFDKHGDYQKMKDSLEETKGIDFLGILDNELYMVEECINGQYCKN